MSATLRVLFFSAFFAQVLHFHDRAMAQIRHTQTTSLLQSKDLAVLLPQNDPELRLQLNDLGFSENWLMQIAAAFSQTSVGEALTEENRADDWQLVSMRAVPCQSLLNRPHPQENKVCWPEVRFVLQPIVRNVSALARIIPFFADDRAVHVLFHYLPQGEGSAATGDISFPSALAKKLKDSAESGRDLPEYDLRRFELLRQQAVQNLEDHLLQLRTTEQGEVPNSQNYTEIGMRPETSLSVTQKSIFKTKLSQFLKSLYGKGATSQLPKEVTAFSLPAGREPAQIDEWVFLQFVPLNANTLRRQEIKLNSSTDGKNLVNFGLAERVSMGRDADALYIAMDTLEGTQYAQELRKNTIPFRGDAAVNQFRIFDSKIVRVPNTTCASCHKLNANLFDFHNLSYFQELPMTISGRVRQDIKHDLEWLVQNQN